jgi:RNA recognition motif-containing protein
MQARGPTDYAVFARNIHFDADADEVKVLLDERIGGVVKVYLIPNRDRTGHHRGFGFAWFSNDTQRMAAIRADRMIWLRGRRIFIDSTRSEDD